jgi:hypothetical protein
MTWQHASGNGDEEEVGEGEEEVEEGRERKVGMSAVAMGVEEVGSILEMAVSESVKRISAKASHVDCM